MTNDLIVCRGLGKRYGSVHALEQIDLTVGEGKIVGLLGPNGSGKTTLIKILCGLLQPSAGQVRIAGAVPGPVSKALVSYLPDQMYVPDWMRVKDLLELFADFYADFSRERAGQMLASLGIQDSQRVKTMSKGTKEKMQLVLVMSRAARLYLLDEPIAGVDPAAREFILNTILRNYNEKGTVLISTHLIGDVEQVLDEAIFLKAGRVIRHEAVDDIREKEGMSVDALFREIFRASAEGGYGIVG